jgi:hypothetical protein
LTSVADTRLLLFMEFPASPETGKKTRDFLEKELKGNLLVPSIVLTEFIEVAGSNIGLEAAKTRIRLLKDRGLQIVVLDEKQALIAGELLLSNGNVPVADGVIASYVKSGVAEYVLSDDAHFKVLGVKTKWL